ncbi:unnamed protein product [Fraxinus pennsylvanica]|uniref:Uncharacterized protein n=1 Tax=Fraxinus pennsylvanica TaxID=56036 RepID=A0AAD1Z984_9LAMI|nr:unnamed protein product [Fraxinus pennsylvanica]
MDAVISATAQVTVEKLLASATSELSLVWSFKKDLRKLGRSLKMMDLVLQDAEKREVTNEAVKLWLKNLRDVTYDAAHVLDKINYENMRSKVEIQNQTKIRGCLNIFSLTPPLAFQWRMARRIKDINMDLKTIEDDANTYDLRVADYAPLVPLVMETDSITVDSNVVGRDANQAEILELITNTNDSVISVLPIVGMGGLGKTTLARSVFNHESTKSLFGEKIWGIGSLRNLRKLDIGKFSESIDFNSFQAALDGIQQSKSLWHLTLYGWEHWDSLPYQIQHLTSLTNLYLVGFGNEALPEWFGGLSSLFTLELINFKKLRHMPSKEAMQRLTGLRSLSVYRCPLLEKSCREERGPEWSKISHIPNIWMGQTWLKRCQVW